MSLDKKIIGGGPAAQCGIAGSTSTNSNKSLQGDNALEGLAAFSYNGSYWIAQTGGQSVYLYDGEGNLVNNANTSGINPLSMGFHNGSIYTYDTYQPTGSGGWKSWPATTGTFTETDHNCNMPNVQNSAPAWHIQDPLNPARLYYGASWDRKVYVCYYADFPSTTVNGYDTGYTIDNVITDMVMNVTFDGNYFWLSEYSSSGGDFFQAYAGGSKGDPFELTGVTIPKVSGFDYYSSMAYNGMDSNFWIKRKSSVTILRQIPDTNAACPTPTYMNFLCVAGGGWGGRQNAGGGGAGGLRTSYGSTTGGANTISEGGLELIGGTYTITIGAGGAGPSSGGLGNNGTDSSITHSSLQTIDCLGGGGGGGVSGNAGAAGGSGGGQGSGTSFGSGRTGQGRNGGSRNNVANSYAGGGGGGANQVGGNSSGTEVGGNGGNGLTVSITGSSVAYAGGGGGGGGYNGGSAGSGGSGGGTDGGYLSGATASCAANTGGGSGGARDNVSTGSGGSGVVILRLTTASYSGVTTGSPTITTSGSDTIIKFTGSGTYVHS